MDNLQRRALIEAKRDPGELPSDFENAIEDMSAAEIADYLFQAMLDDIAAGYDDAADVLSIETEFSVVPKRAIQEMADYVLRFAYDFTQNERYGVKQLILGALQQGTGSVELRKLIKGFFADGINYVGADGTVERSVNIDAWADTVARTELHRAYNMGSMSLYQEVGVKQVMWMAAGDPGECPLCEAADGQVVDTGDSFPSVNVVMPPAHPRCYCTTISAPEEIARYNDPDAVAYRAEKLAHYRSVNR